MSLPNPAGEVAGGAAIIAVAVVFWWNLMSLLPGPSTMPQFVRSGVRLLRLDQHWALFAPYPMTDDGWYVAPATLADGTQVDALTEAPVTWDKPRRVSATYANGRWRKYMINLWLSDWADYRPYFARYLCRRWAARHSDKPPIDRFAVHYMREDTLGPDREGEPTPVLLIEHTCDHEGAAAVK